MQTMMRSTLRAAEQGAPAGGGSAGTNVQGLGSGHQPSNAREPGSPEAAEGVNADGGEAGTDETAAETKARIHKYRKLTEKGEYEEEDWDEERVAKFLSDDWEDEYVIDGQKVSLPRHQAKRNIQLAETSYRRMEDTAKTRKELEERAKRAAENPLEFLDEADGYKFTERYDELDLTRSERLSLERAAEFYELQKLRRENPSEYMRRERARNQRMLDAQAKSQTKQREAAEKQAAAKRFQAEMEPQVDAALKGVRLRLTPENRQRVAQHMNRAQRTGVKMSLADAAQHARQDYVNSLRQDLSEHDGATLEALLGAELSKRLREAQIRKVQGDPVPPPAARETPSRNGAPMSRQAQARAVQAATQEARGLKPIAFSRPTR